MSHDYTRCFVEPKGHVTQHSRVASSGVVFSYCAPHLWTSTAAGDLSGVEGCRGVQCGANVGQGDDLDADFFYCDCVYECLLIGGECHGEFGRDGSSEDVGTQEKKVSNQGVSVAICGCCIGRTSLQCLRGRGKVVWNTYVLSFKCHLKV